MKSGEIVTIEKMSEVVRRGMAEELSHPGAALVQLCETGVVCEAFKCLLHFLNQGLLLLLSALQDLTAHGGKVRSTGAGRRRRRRGSRDFVVRVRMGYGAHPSRDTVHLVPPPGHVRAGGRRNISIKEVSGQYGKSGY